jgi:hypothetical protein
MKHNTTLHNNKSRNGNLNACDLTIQTTAQHNTTADRIKILEIQKEETEEELKCLLNILKVIKALESTTKPNTTGIYELQAFIQRLEKEIEINTGIIEEYLQSIEFIKRGTQIA